MKYGFVGLGNLGSKLAASLARAGLDVVVTDIDAARVAALEARGIRGAPDALAFAADVDALITCLPSPSISAAVLEGEGGALAHMRAGSTWIEMSTTGADDVRRLAALADTRGVDVLEAPVTGGVHRAEVGEITVLVGGAPEVLARHRPAFDAMCGRVIHLGAVGTASTLKVITNVLCLIDLVAMGEALTLAKMNGLDLASAYEGIVASSGNSVEFETYAPVVLNGSLDTGFSLDLGCKDMRLATGMGDRLGIPLELTRAVSAQLEAARERYGGAAWTPRVITAIEERLGINLRAEGFEARVRPPGEE